MAKPSMLVGSILSRTYLLTMFRLSSYTLPKVYFSFAKETQQFKLTKDWKREERNAKKSRLKSHRSKIIRSSAKTELEPSQATAFHI
jgi:hypothetical protein